MTWWLVGTGLVLIVVGLSWPWLSEFGLGRLLGDIVIERGNFGFYFPIVTGLIVSAVLSFILIANAAGVICAAIEYRGTETAALVLIDERIRANTEAMLDEARRTSALPRTALSLAIERVSRRCGRGDGMPGGMNCARSMSRRMLAPGCRTGRIDPFLCY